MGSIFGKQIELDKALDDLVDIEDLEVYRSIREEGERTRRGYSMYTHSEVLRDMVGMSEYHLKQQGYNLVDARVEFDDGKYYAPNSRTTRMRQRQGCLLSCTLNTQAIQLSTTE